MVVKYRLRLYLLSVALLCGFGMLVYRLQYLQVEKRDEFLAKVPGKKELKIRVPGVRGEIRDRNGITLVSNKPMFEVRIVMKDVLDEYRRLLNTTKGKDAKAPKFTYTVPVQGIERQVREDDYVAIFKEMVESKLDAMGLAEPFNSNDLRVHTRTFRGLVPWVYRSNLTFEEFSRFAEHNLGLPGVSVGVRPTRQYLYGALACHILGYVALPDVDKAPDEDKKLWGNYYVPDDYGAAGVEKTFDKYLVGKPGTRTVRVNEKGAIVGEIGYEEPKKGYDVHLTIDARIQMIAEKALRDAGIGRGAVAVIDPNNGQVLGLASVPNYDPNKFVPSISQKDWDALNANPIDPLVGRALVGFSPGSTYKIVTSLAGCPAKITDRRFNCSGSVTYGTKAMQCWIQRQSGGAHGSLDLSTAIMQSCNCFFYQYGNAAGLNNIERVGKMIGLGERSGVELDEEDARSLILPGHNWTRQNKPGENSRSPGFVANVSIGQGLVQASPLQMANVAATVANGGIGYRVTLLHRVLEGASLITEPKPDVRGRLVPDMVSDKQFEIVRRGMWKVVNEAGGTGKAARIPNVEVAGKTGTAQNWRRADGQKLEDNHTWFISFAPYQNPKFAVCALVQNGKSGGSCAAPVVKRVLEQALALDSGYQVAIESLPEINGDFKKHTQISYEGALALNLPGDDADGDTGSADSAQEVQERPRRHQAPTIRKEADAAGSSGVSSQKEVPKAVPVRRAGLFRRLFGR